MATLYRKLGWGTGWLPVNMGSGASASFLRNNHTFYHLSVYTDMGRWK
jgi:hypothetical protein